MMEVESVLVTGANRGIGLEFVNQFVHLPKPPRFVFATYRSKGSAKALEDIKDASQTCQVILIQMDVMKIDDVRSARKVIEGAMKEKGLTLLINNAAWLSRHGFPDTTDEDFLNHFTTNTAGPYRVLREMYPLLQKAAALKSTNGLHVSRAAVLNISSAGGSIGFINEEAPEEYLNILGYGTSKAALNMAMRVVAMTVKKDGILVVQMCPGGVKTDMGTDEAELHVSESVSSMLNTLEQLNETHQGSFLDRHGNTIPF